MYLLGLEKLPPSPFARALSVNYGVGKGIPALEHVSFVLPITFPLLPMRLCVDASRYQIGQYRPFVVPYILLIHINHTLSIHTYNALHPIPCQATSSSPIFNDPCSGPNARQQCVARIELITYYYFASSSSP